MIRLRAAAFTLSGMVARASNQLATVALTLFATRFLGPRDFGVFALASLTTTLIRALLYTGAFEYLLKAREPRQCSTECLAANLSLSVALSILIAVVMVGSIALFGSSQLTTVMLALLPSNLIAAVGAWREALLLRTRRLTLYYSLTSAAVFSAAIMGMVLLFFGERVQALVWQVYIRNSLILILYTVVGYIEWSDRFDRAKLLEVARWSVPRYASMVFNFANNYGVDALVGILLSPAAVGLYRASNRLVTAVSDIFTQPIRLIAMTTFSARAAAGRGSNDIWTRMFALVVATGGSVLAGVAAVSGLVVPLLLGKSWAQTAMLLPIIAITRAVSLIDSVTGPLLVAHDHQRAAFRLQVFVSLIGLPMLVAAARYGLQAATLAVLVAALLGRSVVVVMTARLIPPGDVRMLSLLRVMLIPVVATVAGALITRNVLDVRGLGIKPLAVLSIAGGFAAWAGAMLLMRRQFGAMIAMLQSSDHDVRSPNPHSETGEQASPPMLKVG